MTKILSNSKDAPSDGLGVAVIGAGGHGRCVIGLLRAAGYEPAVVFDDTRGLWGGGCLDVRIDGPIEAARGFDGPAVIAIGNNAARAKIADDLELDWITVVHPFCSIEPDVEIGAGTVVMPGVVMQTGVKIGRHAMIGIRASIAHDATIGDFALVGSTAHVSGHATLKTGAFLGAAGTVANSVTVGEWSVVGLGAAVVRDLPAMVVATGVPAIVKRELDEPYDGPRHVPSASVSSPAQQLSNG